MEHEQLEWQCGLVENFKIYSYQRTKFRANNEIDIIGT